MPARKLKVPTRVALTDAVVKRLPLPASGNKLTFDAAVAGFAARVTAAGARSFVLNYETKAGRQRRITIGASAIGRPLQPVRRLAGCARRSSQGGDPLGELEAERAAPTVAELIDRFEREHLPRKRPGTADDYRQMLDNHIRPHFGRHTKVADVRFADVEALHRKITRGGSNYAANRCVAVLSKMFALAVHWHWRENNPAKGIERNVEYRRQRYLKPDELMRLTQALAAYADQQAANIIRLLLLTGARKGEVLAMRWADIDSDNGIWSKPASSTKQKARPRGAVVGTGAAAAERATQRAASRRICVPRQRRTRPYRRDQERLGGHLQGRRHHWPAHPRPAASLRLASSPAAALRCR